MVILFCIRCRTKVSLHSLITAFWEILNIFFYLILSHNNETLFLNRKGAAQVLVSIKNNLSKMKGCVIKRATIDKVWNRLNCALGCLMGKGSNSNQGSVKTNTLQPCLKVRYRMFVWIPCAVM